MRTSILSFLDNAASQWPNKKAIADDKQSLTFEQWHQYARRIGTVISNNTNKSLRKPVLVFVDRRIEGLVGFLGVTESGNFYVPIDCKMPYERVRLISDVLNPIAAITVTAKDDAILDQISFKGERIKYEDGILAHIDEELLDDIQSQIIDTDPVYSIFTSGSTGVPKGVIISQRGMIDLADWLVETFDFTNEDVLGNQTPFYFDGSVKDICICLKSGATLQVIGRKYFSFPKLLVSYLNENNVTALLWATSAIVLIGNSEIFEYEVPKYVRIVTFAGEAMPAKQLNCWKRKRKRATM